VKPDFCDAGLEIHHSIQGICCGAPTTVILNCLGALHVSLCCKANFPSVIPIKNVPFLHFCQKVPFLAKIAVPLLH
jgi:hypothetical protein